ncbi:AlwI family type II restriction endonuclease [Mycoplasma hafezii]|uniref:AlwI family type II restriction endonuclease n=1 Tax=Mycoplasma hafezii TaxID=525886 RepID=UPI003CF7D70B
MKNKVKALSFSTTLRNPERIIDFLKCLQPFNGLFLNNETIVQIVKEVIKNKVYKTKYILENTELFNVLKDENKTFTNEQLNEIITNSPQNHKEKCFEKGWPSRFDTWYKLIKEFGFINYEMNRKLEITPTGWLLLSSTNLENKINDNDIYLNALMKYQTQNPFRVTSQNYKPLIFTVQVLKYLEQKINEFAGLSKKEISLILCWQNDNYEEFGNFILDLRKQYSNTPTDEILYELCLNFLNSKNEKRFKLSQLLKEGVDDLIRKLRITGLFTLRGNGRYINLNSLRKNDIEYVIKNYSQIKKFKDESDYICYMSEVDKNIVKTRNLEISESINIQNIKQISLLNFANIYPYSKIIDEINNLILNKPSKDEILKMINGPVRFEFLIAIILKKKFPTLEVNPNYIIDDQGIPINHASGNQSDIEIFDSSSLILTEVTLIKNKSQAIYEIPSITRHLAEINKNSITEKYAFFVAPQIHQDAIYMCQFTKWQYNIEFFYFNVLDFIQNIIKAENIHNLRFNILSEVK